MKYKSIKKSLKKRKYSVLSVFLLGIIILMMFSSTKNVIASDNYSNYLYNQELNVYNDRAMILNEKSDNSNNYRNFFDSGFVFPAKLSNQMFNAFTTDYTQYSLNQVYLDNLDSEFAFKSNDISENIITQQNISKDDTTIISGVNDDLVNYNVSYILHPDSDIYNMWDINPTTPTTHYDKINEMFGSGYIDTSVINEHESFTLENTTYHYTNIQNITLELYFYTGYTSPLLTFTLYNDYSFNEIWQNTFGALFTVYTKKFINVDLNKIEINDLKIKFSTTANKGYRIYSVQLRCESGLVNITSYKSEEIPTGFISEGNFQGKYSFIDDIDGSNPLYFDVDESGGTTEVISDIYGHLKVLELDDTSNPNLVSISNSFSEQSNGSIEFYIRINDVVKVSTINIKSDNTHFIYLVISNSKFQYLSSGWHDIIGAIANSWYHIKIDFECTNNGYKGLNQFEWKIFINNTEYGNYLFSNNEISAESFFSHTHTTQSIYKMYFDSIDYSWSEGYYENRNKDLEIDYLKNVVLEFEKNIEYLSNNEYSPVFIDLYSEICLNSSLDINLYIYNYDLENYYHLNNITDIFNFQLNYFRFNESGFYRNNEFKLRLLSNNFTSFFKTYINNFYINITYIKINENGFHELSIKFDKQKDDTIHIGYSLFEIKIYDNFFLYRYSEINELTDNYITNWFNLSYDSIETFEVNIHVRYGLNTLDIEITNILVDIYIDSINVLTFLEQDRKYFLGKHYKSEFNYTCNNRNYLNLTGIIGNYSYNTLKGIRTLSGKNDIIYNRFFNVPLFQENIDVSQRIISQGTVLIENEPEPPKDAYYWSYQTFRLIPISSTYTEVGNWSIEYKPLEVQTYQAKYYYNPEAISERKLGSWKFKIGTIKVNFNFIRNTVCKITNLILLFFQYLMYLVVASLSFIFMFLGCYIIAFLYNICLYYIYIGLLFVLWYLWVLLLWLWTIIIWIWSNIIIPFASWFWNVIVPIIMDWIIKIIAFFLTILIFVLTLGQIDFDETYLFIYDILWLIVRELYEWFMVFMENILYILMFIMLYLICLMYLYFRYLMARARGFDKKAQKYYYTLTFFFTPFMLIFNWVKQLLDVTPVA